MNPLIAVLPRLRVKRLTTSSPDEDEKMGMEKIAGNHSCGKSPQKNPPPQAMRGPKVTPVPSR